MSGRAGAVAGAAELVDDGRFLEILRRRVAIPTESQEPSRLPDLQRYLEEEIAPALSALGFSCRILPNPVPGGGPFLIAERHEGHHLPTLLTYGHGDVVRGIPEQWRAGLDPWRITVEGERWYGRGTADNKGQHAIVIEALGAVIAARGALGFNAKMLIETSEEIGSVGLDALLETEAAALSCDLLLASDGPRLERDKVDVKLGNRGAVAFDLTISLREGSRHSGHWGGVLEDPGVILAQALASITSPRGQILIPQWLPKAIPPKVKAALAGITVDPSDPSLKMPDDWGEPGLTVAEKMYGWTSFIVLAFLTGRPENPVNGVQPDARATCQIRHTADVDAEGFLPALRAHLDARGFHQVEITDRRANRFPAWRTDPENPWVERVLASVTRTMGTRPTLMPNSSGGLPSEIFARHLGCPVIWIPHSYGGCRQHGPDEHVLVPILREGLSIMAGLFWDIGESEGETA
ncbi:M20 family metallopeptidase [Oceanicella sp. SM1341]|uniref:M20 family metallopeptidase n=1 Tax=Oceanicella sp. SM1341 TaxID=1548889 RepID=UPI000E5031EF|nr:M20 family metallopeptidase [Oceanicella sp. SM1341]